MKINRFRGKNQGKVVRWITGMKTQIARIRPFRSSFRSLERGNGSIPLCLSLDEIGIYGGAARTLGVLLRWGRWEGGVTLR